MGYFAVPYDIHFDDTMAYGSHHFLTNFKFQCAGREHLLFGPRFFEVPELRRDFEQVLLLTYEGYTRNLAPAVLGDRLVVLTTLEEWGEVSLRFCFRTLKSDGTPVACGYQTVLCADRAHGELCPFPASFRRCYEAMENIDEPVASQSFKDRVLRGGAAVNELFPESLRQLARTLLAGPASLGTARVVEVAPGTLGGPSSSGGSRAVEPAPGAPTGAFVGRPQEPKLQPGSTVFLFGGQGTFEPELFIRLKALHPELRAELAAVGKACAALGIDVAPLLAAQDAAAVRHALEQAPLLDQLGIYLSGVLGARWLRNHGVAPGVFVGHSFGEIAAMTAAGALDLRAGAEVVCHRIRALRTVSDDAGTLAAVALDEAETAQAIKDSGARSLELAGRNHARQTVVAGPRAELEQLRDLLQGRGQGFTFVSSRYPFHHPVLAPAAEAFRAALAGVPMRPPQGHLYSPIERREYTGGHDELADALASHLVRPFDFLGTVETLVRAGCTRFVDCGTDGRLARIVQRILPAGSSIEVSSIGGALPADAPVAAKASGHDADTSIAVVSLGCMLPGGAKDPEAYWRNILGGVSGIVDHGQLQPELVTDFAGPRGTPDRTYTLLTGRVRDSDLVAPPGLEPARFQRYIREQKLLAIALSQALRGLEATAIYSSGRIQCLLGSTGDGSSEYDDALCLEAGEALLRERGVGGPEVEALGRAARAALGVEAGSLALAPHATLQAVVTDVVGRGVPTTLLDAACASSLYAIALGMKALEQGEADLVFAGGVFSPGPGNSCLFSQFKGLSATGSRPFDEQADGVIFGEGAGMVGLMRLPDALAAGLRVHAIIRGAGLSSDGRSSSANVPRSEGQVAAMEACYAAAEVDPSSIQYVEAHGTATPAGDATELKSIARVFGGKRRGIQLSSVKALIGHTGWAAGAASVIKLCKAFEHRLIPPQSNFDRPGAELRALGADFEVSTREQPWPENGAHPRRAATSGFGFGGTNAHLVLEEYRGGTPAHRPQEAGDGRDELVVVAAEGLFPDARGLPVAGVPAELGARFDTGAVQLPSTVRLLPDIAEDMDLTQRLGLAVASSLVQKLGAFEAMRSSTAIVLGLEGKTRRGVEATQRVLAASTRRKLREFARHDPEFATVIPLAERFHEVVTSALRPSGPYTLQGMMPNVTPGRIAGALDTKGPNFVVDAGAASLSAALRASRGVLESGFELVLVGSTHVRRPGEGAEGEGVVMLAVTTAAKAARRGLKPLCHVRMSEGGQRGAGHRVELPAHSAKESLTVFRSVLAAAEGRDSTLVFHPDAATGARLEVQLVPATARAEVAAPASALVRNSTPARESAAPAPAPAREGRGASSPVSTAQTLMPAQMAVSPRSLDGVTSAVPAGQTPARAGNGAVSQARGGTVSSASDGASAPASVAPESSGGFDHAAPIHYHAPVLVERSARVTRSPDLRGKRVLFIAQDEAVARELASQAEALCGSEHLIVLAGTSGAQGRIRPIDLSSEETAEAGLDALGFDPQVILAVCRLTPGAGEAEVVSDTALRHEALELLFLSARRAYERLTAGEVELASLCIGGVGPRRTLHPMTGLFAGMLKSIGREVPARNVRAISTASLPLAAALQLTAIELGSEEEGGPSVEVCFDGQQRCVRRLRPTRVTADPASTLDSRSVVLLTGGGRGVTAVLAGALLKRYGCTVVLVGRSDPAEAPEQVLQARDEDLPQVEREFYATELARTPGVRMPELRKRFERYLAARELRATLDGLARLPGRMLYRAVDVTRPEQVERVVQELAQEHGRLDLVVHGAGTQTSKKLNRRRLGELRANLDTKLLGLRNLRDACASRFARPVPFHVLTSAFSFIGNDGQADYGAANEALDRLCAWVSDASQEVRWASVGWLAWDGIGMTRGSEYHVLGASRRLRGIRAEEGEELFLQLVDGRPREAINVQLTESERAWYGLELLPVETPPPEPPRPTRRELVVDAASVPCLEDHLVRGTPTLPGAWALDLMLQAALGDGRPELRTVTIEDVRFSRFIRVKPGGRQALRAECTPLVDEPGRLCVQVRLTGDIVHASGVVLERDVVYAEARFTLTAEPPRGASWLDAARPSGSGVSVHDPHCAPGSPIELRKMFDCLEEIRLERTTRFARLGLPESPSQAGRAVPALVLDAALRLSAMHVDGVSDSVFAPVQLQRVTFDRSLVEGQGGARLRLSLKALAPRVDGDVVQCGSVAAIDDAGRLRMLFEGGLARPMA
ncbi:SDR family NAD(P)-dependent oxidoreductase [Pyxidicoccus fallax]|uniref:SDR family NAD(P)-dependent oxidoreductase n=1 Tax=Pyxidicoccus fallax TaxID=394095 RepID=A0A848LIF8_9BACT|nr:type I polyketide synthase [Pyxidicoccus fallax]NMO17500.1 SDR family NAD(P)-dependent oxidoreductase [Pyxidicoccus fallax]NPC79627.1 SDR family NAD(P)-dependent oxidoreductase [Pyxidicoccus fallax]